ncbi:hypothetical protein ACFPK9_07495 [Rubritalea spongiae]|uniref:Uncharacterized protein n=1 Tax=Rubritalea spongiae TaxID=430797 RepID=A0ABW5E036_9BACT
MKTTLIPVLTSILCLHPPAEAAPLTPGRTLGIDFGNAAGVTPHWRTILTKQGATRNQSALTDTTGTPIDAVQFEWRFAAENVYNNDDSEDRSEMPGLPAFPASALGDWMGVNIQKGHEGITLRFSKLDDTLTYSLTLGGANAINNNNADTVWTINGSTSSETDASDATKAFVTFTSLRTQGDGSLVIRAHSNQSFNADGKALKIAVIASLALKVEGPAGPECATLITIGGTSLMLKEGE